MNDNMRLVAARIYSTGSFRNFDLVYRHEQGNYARYTWTDRPGEDEHWTRFSARKLQSWLCKNRAQIVEVCPELAKAASR
jgi:hypothetical protein